MPRSNLELPRWPDDENPLSTGIHPDGLLGGLVNAPTAHVPVSAPTGRDLIVDVTKYPEKPEGAVQGNTGMDDWVKGRFSHTFMSRIAPAYEKAFGQSSNGELLPGTSKDDSHASCPGNGVLCAHTHPLQSDAGWDVRSKIVQDWRLGFGKDDYLSLMHNIPNYMMNYQRHLQVLEYTPSGGYTVRDLGIVPYLGPDR